MEIIHSEFKRCDLIKVTGRVDSATAPKLGEKVNEILDAGRFRLAIDFSDVDFISSAGLRVLISTQKTTKRYNRGELVLANVPENVMGAFDLAGLTPLFKFFDDTTAAVANF